MTVASAVDDGKAAKSHGGAGYFQVDAMKAVMIFLVVFDHTVPWIIKDNLGYVFWERISIPMFMVIMGFNMALSFKRKGDVSLRELYSKNYFKRKFLRFLIPFLVLYVASTLIGLIIYNFDFHALINNQLLAQWDLPYLLIGILPFWGPGNWFIPLLFQCVLFLPIIYKAFSKKPALTLILCFAGEIACWLFATSFLGWTIWMVLFLVSIPAYLSAIGLGMWFSSGHNITDRRNLFMWILFSLSTIYMIAYQFFDFRFDFVRGDYNFLFYPYSAFIFLIGMKLLPKESESEFTKVITWIGKATYHILLTQILYLGIVFAMWGGLSYMYTASVFGIGLEGGTSGFTHLLINWMICIPVGVLWWFLETKTLQQLSGVQYQRGGAVDVRSWWESFRYGLDPIIREVKFVLKRMKGNLFSLVGIIIIMFFSVVALIAPVIAPSTPNNCWRGDPYKMKIREDWKGSSWLAIDPPPTPPSPEHPFGTVVGYDIYYGCVWGTRTVFRTCLLVTLTALAIGLIIGCVAGYFGGIIDQLLMLFTDIFFSLPSLVFAMLLIVATVPRVTGDTPESFIGALKINRIILALAITSWPTYARLVRGEVIRVKNENYVEAAKAVGCSNLRTITRHIFPNSISPIIAMTSLNIGGVALAISTLTFLGIGVPIGYADWTPFISSSRNLIVSAGAQHLYTFMIPGAFLIAFILGWTLLGDTLREILDPRVRRM